MPTLLIDSGPLSGKRVQLPAGGAIGIGRDPKCAIRLSDELSSRIHCVLRGDGGDWQIEDRGSSNGTWVNGVAIHKHRLQDSDRIQVGETKISFVDQAEDAQIGRTLAGYEIEGRLGRGAAGTVYRARQISLGRTVALKILSKKLASEPEFVRHFLDEGRAAARLNHPHVVQVYDAGRQDDEYYISMEFCENGTLQELLARKGTLDPRRAAQVAIDASKALAFAERHGIVHRDIKPANLLIDGDGTIKVGDLGIAADLRSGTEESNKLFGSPRYMSPEQATGQPVDHRADIYSLGATLYRSVTGRPPFDGPDARSIVRARAEQDSPPVGDAAPDLPATLARAIDTMMARDPDDRFASAADIEAALTRPERKRAPARTASGAHQVGARSPRAHAPRRSTRGPSPSRPFPVAAAAAIGAVAVAVVLFLVARGPSDSPVSDSPASPTGSTTSNLDRSPADERDRSIPSRTTPATPPPSTKRAAPQQAKRAVVSLQREFESGSLTVDEASSKLGQLARRFATAGELEEFERLSASIDKAAKEALALAIDKVVELAGAGSLQLADEKLLDFQTRYPAEADLLSKGRTAIEQGTSVVVTRTKKSILAHVEGGRTDEARQTLSELESTIPGFGRSAEIVAIQDELESLIVLSEREADRLVTAEREIRDAIASLDFDRAQEIVEEVDPKQARSDFASTRRSVGAAHRTWAALASAIGSKKRWSIAGPESSGPESSSKQRTWRIDSPAPLSELPASGWTSVRLKSGSGRRAEYLSVTLLALDRKILESMAHSGGLDAADASVGIDVLLAARRGDGALAAQFPWRSARWRSLSEFASQFESEPEGSVAADLWGWLATDCADLIAKSRDSSDHAQIRADARELWIKARTAELSLGPPTAFFHAESVKFDDGNLSLTYDFSTREQIDDFFDVTGGAVRWNDSLEAIEFRGEARFAEGNPFRESLRVDAALAKGGFSTKSPNVNIALWTDESDQVTATIDLGELRRRFGPGGDDDDDTDSESVDYIAVGHGYFIELSGGGQFGRLLRGFLPSFCKEPVFIVLTGARGRRLHANLEGDIVWDEPTGKRWRDRSHFRVASDEDRFIWRVNGRAMPFTNTRAASRLVSEGGQRRGSVSFFTNGETVRYTEMVISGQFDPSWIGKRVEATVRAELDRLDPDSDESLTAEPPNDDDS